jgi:hypothetical protein
MPDTIREGILKNRVQVLQSITVANGYATDFKTVERLIANPLQAGLTYPCAILHDVDEVSMPLGEETAVNFIYRLLGLVVEFWMLEKTKGSLSSDLNAALGDIVKAFLNDYQCGGLAEDTSFGPTITVLAEKNEPLGGMQVRFEIQYRFFYADPTQG